MKKNKYLKEYEEKYSNIPNEPYERFINLMDSLQINDKDLKQIRKSIEKISKKKYNTIKFIFYFTPQATPRPRSSKFSKVFYVSKKIDYNKLFKQFMDECSELKHVITTPCEMLTETYFDIPTQMSKVEKILSEIGLIHHVSKPDWDNLGKTYSDMIQKHCILEDSLIYDGRVRKSYSSKPRVVITIKYLTSYDCKYNKRKIESWKFYKESKNIQRVDSII